MMVRLLSSKCGCYYVEIALQEGGEEGKTEANTVAGIGVCTLIMFTLPAPTILTGLHSPFSTPPTSATAATTRVQEGVSVLTTEIEHIDADAVEAAAKAAGLDFEPTPHTIRIIQVCVCVCVAPKA